MRFMTREEINKPLPISIGLSGPSGCGKTWTALTLARGMARELYGKDAPIAFADTENRRALHYRDAFPEMLDHYFDFSPELDGKMLGYSPERWIEMLDFVRQADAAALVVDSFSHAWEGVNGVLDLQAKELERLTGGDKSLADKRSQLAWAAIKPRYRKLINEVIRFPKPVVLCTRAKPVMQDPRTHKNARATKTRRDDVPYDIAADGDLLFEMTAMMILDPARPGTPKWRIKVADQHKRIILPDEPITEETGRALAKWSKRQADGSADKAILDAARAAARSGTAAVQAWWKEASQDARAIANVIIDELKQTAAEADTKGSAPDESVFDQPGPTPEEVERKMQEVAEEVRREETEGDAR